MSNICKSYVFANIFLLLLVVIEVDIPQYDLILRDENNCPSTIGHSSNYKVSIIHNQ